MAKGKEIRLLLVERNDKDFNLVENMLSSISAIDFSLIRAKEYQTGLKYLLEEDFDVCLTNYLLDEQDGITLMKEAMGKHQSIPFIILTPKDDETIDKMVLESGAYDYLVKDELTAPLLERSIRYAVRNYRNIIELQEKEERYRSLYNRSIDAIFIMNEEFEITEVNPAFVTLIATEEDEVNGKSITELLIGSSEIQFFINKLKEHGSIRQIETELVNVEGKKLSCLITCQALITSEQQFIGYQGIIHDITKRKKAEEDMLIAEKLSVTGTIARSIAHEVRNPLTNVNLAIDQLSELFDDKLREEGGLYIDIINRNVQRVEQLIKDLMSSSKPAELNLQMTPLEEVIEKALKLCVDRMKLRGIELQKNYVGGQHLIHADKEYLNTALLNVFVNATEAIDKAEGKITVDIVESDNTIDLKISDNGRGISEEGIKKLFDPFYSKKKSGMGLGLTNTQNVINSHKGSIQVESKIGFGTTFIIHFPKVSFVE